MKRQTSSRRAKASGRSSRRAPRATVDVTDQPVASLENALSRLANPPWFTGTLNPHIASFVQEGEVLDGESQRRTVEQRGRRPNGEDSSDKQSRGERKAVQTPTQVPTPVVDRPLALDVTAGKTDPLYHDHPYHTKVPHRAILRYLLHYTRPGDVVLDGFCGSGMTGVAAQLCGDRPSLAAIGLSVDSDGRVRTSVGETVGWAGSRRAVLADLSPLAGLLAYHHNAPIDPEELRETLARVVESVQAEWGWLQSTLHGASDDQTAAAIAALDPFPADPRPVCDSLPWGQTQFVIWSDVFSCAECGGQIVFYDDAIEPETGRVREPFTCRHCGCTTSKRRLQRVLESVWDPLLNTSVQRARQVPVRVNYEYRGKRYEKPLDAFDLALAARLERERPPFAVPTDRMPEGRESRRNDVIGLTHVHHFYPPANLWLMGALAERIHALPQRLRQSALLVHSAANLYASRLRRFRAGKKGGGPLSGTLYVSSLNTPASMLQTFARNARVFVEAAELLRRMPGQARVSVQSSTAPIAPAESIDYVFVDPPFGGNLMYAELNFLWEAWLGAQTDASCEAVENPTLGKGLDAYQRLLTDCFRQFHAALKTDHWMTVVFHHSDRRVWHALQSAIRDAGFSVVDVRTLDKCQSSFKQQNHAGSVKHDLVISARKSATPARSAREFSREDMDRVWTFVGDRLAGVGEGEAEQRERTECLLFSRLVADCVGRGVEVPLSAADFYAGLRERFDERDGRFYPRRRP